MMLAGFNIPVPEDGMLFLAGILAAKHPEMTEAFRGGICRRVQCGHDLLRCCSLSRPRLYKIKWFAKMVSKERMAKVNSLRALWLRDSHPRTIHPIWCPKRPFHDRRFQWHECG